MPPEQPLPLKCYRIYQVMWANNGDTISRQYAGTAALKVTPSSQQVLLTGVLKRAMFIMSLKLPLHVLIPL